MTHLSFRFLCNIEDLCIKIFIQIFHILVSVGRIDLEWDVIMFCDFPCKVQVLCIKTVTDPFFSLASVKLIFHEPPGEEMQRNRVHWISRGEGHIQQWID